MYVMGMSQHLYYIAKVGPRTLKEDGKLVLSYARACLRRHLVHLADSFAQNVRLGGFAA